MKGLVHFLSICSLLMLVYSISLGGHSMLSADVYFTMDLLLFFTLIALMVQDKVGHPVLATALIWLTTNYIVDIPYEKQKWWAFDGFALAAILSQTKIPLI